MVDLLESLDRSRAPMLAVLMYHRIGVEEHLPELDPSLLSATPREFEHQLQYLASRRRVLSLAELLAVRRGHMQLPRRAVVVTFDDGYRDFREHAWPALRHHDVPATLFIPTAYPGARRAFWWDRLHAAFLATERRAPLVTPAGTLPLASAGERQRAAQALKEWVRHTPHHEAMAGVDRVTAELGGHRPPDSILGWAELRELAQEGLDIGPHTRTHPLLDRVTLAQAKEEIFGSATDLEREIGRRSRAFAFPAGALTDAVVRSLPEAGIELAFTTIRGRDHLDRIDWLRIHRINVGRRSTLPIVQAQLLFSPTSERRNRRARQA